MGDGKNVIDLTYIDNVVHSLLLAAYAGDHVEPVIVSRKLTASHRGTDGTGPRFGGTEHQRADARVYERADAHQARLDRHAQDRTRQAIVARRPRRFANRHDFCVCGWIA